MTMKRAFSTLELKAFDGEDGTRRFTGIASTPSTDRGGDVVDPKGAQFKLPIPLLLQHDHAQPIGWITAAKVTAKGIEVEGEVTNVPDAGTLKARLDEAWQSLKYGLIRGLSIGFKPLEFEEIKGSWGLLFKKWEWLELSAVTIPMNAEANITTIKAFDDRQLAASGHKPMTVVRLSSKPGASGKTPAAPTEPLEGNEMNVAEQLKAFRAQRAEKAARMQAIMEKSATAGETLDQTESDEYDTLATEIGTIDKHLERLTTLEKSLAAGATSVVVDTKGVDPVVAASANRGGSNVIAVAKKLPPGVAFARLAGIMALSKGSISEAVRIGEEIFPEEKPLHSVIKNMGRFNKAAVDIGTTLDSDYALPLVQYRTMADEFIEWLRPQTVIGRIPGLRRVPFHIQVPRQTSGGAASWVGETLAKPVTQIALDMVQLKHKKLATIAVISQELARFSQPSAEMILRDTLAGAIIQQMDLDFIDPTNAGTTDVKPASITNGVSAIPSSGDTEDRVREDIRALFAPFIAANLTPQNGVWIMSATNALSLSLMMNSLGQPAFPGINMNGGVFNGLPVVVSQQAGSNVILLNASDILLADDGQVVIDSSSEASLQMDSAPDNPTSATTVLVSLWQRNLLGIKAERFIDWTKARAASVQYLSGVEWGLEST